MKSHDDSPQIVYLVDDDDSLRTALIRLLRSVGHEVRGYASASEFLLERRGPLRGCLLLDVRMPGGPSGLEIQAGLARQAEMLPIIFLTGHGDIPMSVQAIKAGAFDFLTKPVEREALLATVNSALASEAEIWRTGERRRELLRRVATLTHCEHEVYRRVIEGQPNKQIASEVSASERTVKAHRARIMAKMGATSLADLVHIADEMDSGLHAQFR